MGWRLPLEPSRPGPCSRWRSRPSWRNPVAYLSLGVGVAVAAAVSSGQCQWIVASGSDQRTADRPVVGQLPRVGASPRCHKSTGPDRSRRCFSHSQRLIGQRRISGTCCTRTRQPCAPSTCGSGRRRCSIRKRTRIGAPPRCCSRSIRWADPAEGARSGAGLPRALRERPAVRGVVVRERGARQAVRHRDTGPERRAAGARRHRDPR
jgi:hypothetical protein